MRVHTKISAETITEKPGVSAPNKIRARQIKTIDPIEGI